MNYYFSLKDYKNYEEGNKKKWVLGNGLGGYSSISIINSQYRKYDGYLIYTKESPINRMMGLVKTSEKIYINDLVYDLESQKYETEVKEGYIYLKSFILDLVPKYKYLVDGIEITKIISPQYKKNTVGIRYIIKSNKDAKIKVIPHFNIRFAGDVNNNYDTYDYSIDNKIIKISNNLGKVYFKANSGEIVREEIKFTDNLIYDYDFLMKDLKLDKNYKPVSIILDIKKNRTKIFDFECSINKRMSSTKIIIESNINRLKEMLINTKLEDEFAKNLALSADNFICYRKSTKLKTVLAGLPWFSDWGRDTMISFTGLLLVPKRFEEAKEVLKSFALYEKNGLIPNMFPDSQNKPLYNTVDASLWYFYAVYKYLEYTNDYEFIKTEIYNTLISIINNYQKGTDFSIKMNDDFLISCGSNLDQVTWMDVRVNDIVVTPRHGKPVEINALWYNALMILDMINKKLNIKSFVNYYEMANKVKASFKKFYNKNLNCLYDVIDEYDDSIRPNMLFAISLPYKLLDYKLEKSIVDLCFNDLYNGYGIRSLSIKDDRFKKIYEGELFTRDLSYHMGTTWGFLLGTFLEAHYKVYKDKNKIKEFIDIVKTHLFDGCINGYAEIFDGLFASTSKGCYNQAWSVAEILRVYYEILLR